MAAREGNFLETALPVRAIAHLTTPHPKPLFRLDGLFSSWIQGMQSHHRTTLAWIHSIENSPQRHIHAALIAAFPLDCDYAAHLWQAIAAPLYVAQSAIVEPYIKGLCGLGYILKRLGSSQDECRFSDNMTAFAPAGRNSRFPTNSAQRRQRRRIMVQLEQAAHQGKR
jgi:hypothetical protein